MTNNHKWLSVVENRKERIEQEQHYKTSEQTEPEPEPEPKPKPEHPLNLVLINLFEKNAENLLLNMQRLEQEENLEGVIV